MTSIYLEDLRIEKGLATARCHFRVKAGELAHLLELWRLCNVHAENGLRPAFG